MTPFFHRVSVCTKFNVYDILDGELHIILTPKNVKICDSAFIDISWRHLKTLISLLVSLI